MPTPRPTKQTRPRGRSTEQRLVAATLDLIVRNGGCRGVNLRQIAARARCAHTNAYNYFDSLEELFWAALLQALEFQAVETERKLRSTAGVAEPLRTLLTTNITFAQKNPGLYRLFWFEPLTGKPPASLLQRLDDMRQLWVRLIGARLAALRSTTDPVWAGQIIHGYFHGEVCKLVGRHAFLPQSADDRERIVANTMALVDLVAAGGPHRDRA
jgi:AcrR family transcriptional regulator